MMLVKAGKKRLLKLTQHLELINFTNMVAEIFTSMLSKFIITNQEQIGSKIDKKLKTASFNSKFTCFFLKCTLINVKLYCLSVMFPYLRLLYLGALASAVI